MSGGGTRAMRDVLIEGIRLRMAADPSIFFLTADLGAPALDALRAEHPGRFLNVGIAEQNLVNVAAGLALEGCTVYAYAIAPFLAMRACEQIRNNLALLSHTHEVNVNLVGLGAGFSYGVSGPTHHSLEDLAILRTLPGLAVFSPSDWVLCREVVRYTIERRSPKYLRLDGKALPAIYPRDGAIDVARGFAVLAQGDEICLVTTGYPTHTALRVVDRLAREGVKVGLVDVFLLKPLPEEELVRALARYRDVLTVEEAFTGKGGLDALVAGLLRARDPAIRCAAAGVDDAYRFEMGGRERLHELCGLDEEGLLRRVRAILARGGSA